jgi:hypothetical protein
VASSKRELLRREFERSFIVDGIDGSNALERRERDDMPVGVRLFKSVPVPLMRLVRRERERSGSAGL